MLRLWTSTAPLAALCWATCALAQGAAPPGPDSEPPPAQPDTGATAAPKPPGHQPALRVVVQGEQANLDHYRVQQAIERELGVVVRGDEQPGVVGTLTVTATGPDALEMAYQGKDGRRSLRTVTLPADTDQRIDTVALVAGNLVRDETGELIESLRPALKPVEPSATESRPVEPAPASATAPVVTTKPTRGDPPPVEASDDRQAVPELPSKPVNLSLFHPLAIYPDSHELRFYIELGLGYSYVGRVTGASVTGFVSRLRYGFSGVQVAGLAGLTGGPSHGLSLAGIAAYQTGPLDGALVGGAVTWAKGDLAGADIAGALAVRDGRSSGIQLAGAVAIGSELDGAQVGGALTLSRQVTGLQLAGAVNGAERVSGVMLAGALNLASERATGLQLGTINVAQSVHGLQFGIVNVARQAEGAQVGLINIAEKVDGASVGLIPIAGNGSQHLMFWTTPGVALGNIGAKFRVGPYYSILGFGYDPDGDGPDRALPAAGMGGQYDVSRVYFACDALVQSSFKASDFGQNETFVSLRPQLGVRVLPWLAAFGGVAVVSGPHDDNWNDGKWSHDLKVRGLAGLELLNKY